MMPTAKKNEFFLVKKGNCYVKVLGQQARAWIGLQMTHNIKDAQRFCRFVSARNFAYQYNGYVVKINPDLNTEEVVWP